MIDVKKFRQTYCWGCSSLVCLGASDDESRNGCSYWQAEVAKEFAKEHLPKDKYEHSLRVLTYVPEVIVRYKGANKNKACIAAILHDVVEDSDASFGEIEEKFGSYIRNCVCALTHIKGEETYPEYIDRVMDSPFPEVRAVKHADMKDHLLQKETLTPRLKEKYFEVIDRFI